MKEGYLLLLYIVSFFYAKRGFTNGFLTRGAVLLFRVFRVGSELGLGSVIREPAYFREPCHV